MPSPWVMEAKPAVNSCVSMQPTTAVPNSCQPHAHAEATSTPSCRTARPCTNPQVDGSGVISIKATEDASNHARCLCNGATSPEMSAYRLWVPQPVHPHLSCGAQYPPSRLRMFRSPPLAVLHRHLRQSTWTSALLAACEQRASPWLAKAHAITTARVESVTKATTARWHTPPLTLAVAEHAQLSSLVKLLHVVFMAISLGP